MSADDTRWDPGEVDRRFDDIVAGWDDDSAEDPFTPRTGDGAPGSAGRVGPTPAAAPPAPLPVPPDPPTEAELRRRRQEQRRAERRARRAEEVAELAEERARMAAEYGPDGDPDDPDDHFVPPEPPQVPRPRGRTVLGVLVVLLGIGVVVGPNVLSISPDSALLLAVLLIVAGGTLLVTGLRRGRGDPGDGWDDGSRV